MPNSIVVTDFGELSVLVVESVDVAAESRTGSGSVSGLRLRLGLELGLGLRLILILILSLGVEMEWVLEGGWRGEGKGNGCEEG